MKTSIKFLLGVLFSAGLFFGASGAWIWHTLHTPANTGDKEILFVIEPGQSLSQIAASLESKKIISQAILFQAYARYQKAATRILRGNTC